MTDRRTATRIGFCGAGRVAQRHASVLGRFADVELVAVTDVDRARNSAFAKAHGIRPVPDLDALLAQDLDAIYVCVPPFAHGAVEVGVAGAGVAMFVEKPLAVDEATAEWVGRRIAASGVLTRAGHHWRCAEPVQRARCLLEGRTIRLVSGSWLDRVPPVPWWSDRTRSGGPLVEQAVHVLDMVRVLVGEVAEVHAVAAGWLPGGNETATAAVLSFADGPVGTFTTTCVLPGKHRAGLEIVTDGMVLGVGEDWLEVSTEHGAHRMEYDPWTARESVDRTFVDVLRGSPVAPGWQPPDYADALRSHRLACALGRSITSGRAEQLRWANVRAIP